MSLTVHYVKKDFRYNSFMLNMKCFGKSHTSKNVHDFFDLLNNQRTNQNNLEIHFVANNAPNITKTINLDYDWNGISCFAHTLQLSMDDATKAKKGKASAISLPEIILNLIIIHICKFQCYTFIRLRQEFNAK